VLRSLRNSRGGPAIRVRVVAALVALGMIALAAPAVVPVLRWLLNILV
jgi:hypothetical protein